MILIDGDFASPEEMVVELQLRFCWKTIAVCISEIQNAIDS